MASLLDLDAARSHRSRKGTAADLVYPTAKAWNGQTAELYKRNSGNKQIDNERAQFQDEKLSAYLLDLGYAVRLNDEQGTSGGRLSARKVMNGILERLISGDAHRLAVVELSRLTRDERQLDPAYIAFVVTEHCNGRLLTLGREWNLFDSSDRRQYDIDTMMAGWRRQDDKEKALQGMQQYIENVIRRQRPITMPTKLKFGYKRITTGNIDKHGRAERTVERDLDWAPSMEALRSACNAQRTLAAVCRELNQKQVPGPRRTYVLGTQWQTTPLRLMLETDWYAGVWTPFSELQKPASWRSAVPTFDPLSQRRHEPSLAWFTEQELAYWREKLLDPSQPIIRRRQSSLPNSKLLQGILYCANCSTPTNPKHLVCTGHMSNTNASLYECTNRRTGTCRIQVGETLALKALLAYAPTIQARTTDIVTRLHVLVAGGGAADLERKINAVEARRRYIKTEWIDTQTRVDPEIKTEYLDLGDQLANLRTVENALSGQTETIRRAAEILALLGGDLPAGLKLLAPAAQAAVLSALVAEAHLTATGHAGSRRVSITHLRTTTETVLLPTYSDYGRSAHPSDLLRVPQSTLPFLDQLAAALRTVPGLTADLAASA